MTTFLGSTVLDEVGQLEDLIDRLLGTLETVIQNGEVLSDEFQGMIAEELKSTMERISDLKGESGNIQEEPITPTPQQPRPINAPSSSSQLIWILAGQREDVFLQYLQTYPDPELQQLLRNPGELQRTIQQLHQMMPSGKPPVSKEGIPHAEINSSNIYGFKYDPKTQKLFVKFQGNEGSGQGSVYSYDSVPLNVYKAFESGAIPAKTNGQNKFGRWWVGKNPSLGAAFYELIKRGGYPYQKMN